MADPAFTPDFYPHPTRPAAWPAGVALLALALMGWAVGRLWYAEVPAAPAALAAAPVSSASLASFTQAGVQPGAPPPIETGRDVPLYRGTEGAEFFRFRFARHGEVVTAGYRVRLGPQHEFYVLQDFDCAVPRVRPLAAGPTIMELRFAASPQFGPLDDSHSDGRLREIFCAMRD